MLLEVFRDFLCAPLLPSFMDTQSGNVMGCPGISSDEPLQAVFSVAGRAMPSGSSSRW
jgi:hypothetical protein